MVLLLEAAPAENKKNRFQTKKKQVTHTQTHTGIHT